MGLAITSTFGRYDRAGPGHPAGARTIVGRSNLGASPEAIKAVPRLRGAHGRLMVPRFPRTYGTPLGGVPFPGVTHTYGVLTPGYSHPTATRSFMPRGRKGRFAIPAAKRRCNSSPTSSEARAMVWGTRNIIIMGLGEVR